MFVKLCGIRLVGLMSVYVNPGLCLVNLAVLVLPPSDAKGKPAIERECKNISNTTFLIVGQIM